MSKRAILVVVVFLIGVIAGAVACQETPQANADSRASDFLQVGKYYSAGGSDGEPYYFSVEEIVNDSWIVYSTDHSSGWLNVNELVYITEY